MNKYSNFTTWDQQEQEWLDEPGFKSQADKLEAEYQVAKAIIAKRLEKKLTQSELATKAHTSQSAIARAESGYHSVTMAFLKKVAHALDANLQVSLT